MSESSAAAPGAAEPAAPTLRRRPRRAPRQRSRPRWKARRARGTIALSAATFMIVLDTSIANVSIPAISGDMGVSTSQGTWVITSFAVANAIAVPLTGWLTQRFGQVKLFTFATLLFVLASWLCGLAPNIESLIAFRVLQGLVAGPLIPLSQALLLSSYPRAQCRHGARDVVDDHAGRAGRRAAARRLDHRQHLVAVDLLHQHPRGPRRRVRRRGRSTASASRRRASCRSTPWASGCSSSGSPRCRSCSTRARSSTGSRAAQIVTLAVVAVVGFVFFLIWELTEDHPVVDLTLFARPQLHDGRGRPCRSPTGFSSATSCCCRCGCRRRWATPPPRPASCWRRSACSRSLMSPIVGACSAAVDPRRIATVSFLLFALVSWMRSRFNTQVDLATLMVPTIIQGAAVACFFIPLVSITLAGLPPEKIASASGLSNFVRITAGAFGTSISTTLWENRAAMHHAHLAEAVNGGSLAATAALDQLRASGLGADAGARQHRPSGQPAGLRAGRRRHLLRRVRSSSSA